MIALPPPVAAYFAADEGKDASALARTFAPSGSVRDEHQQHVGHAAIAEWWRVARARYAYVAEPVEAVADGGAVQVRARVTGSFPGSPAMLTYVFQVEGSALASLEIGA